MPKNLQNQVEEDQVQGQGIHPLNHGYMWRQGSREVLFSPSAFAEAHFALMNREQRRTQFDELTKKVDKNSGEAEKHPHIAKWIETTRKNGRKYADTRENLTRTDFAGLEHDIQHSEVKLLKDTEGIVMYKEVEGLRVPFHRHISTKNLTSANPLMTQKVIDENVVQLGKFSHQGGIILRVKSKEHGNLPEAMRYWDVEVSNPFLGRSKSPYIMQEFDVDSGVQFHRHHKRKGWLWCNVDEKVLRDLEKMGLDSTRSRQTVLIPYHGAVALTKIALEHAKQGVREIKFLENDLEAEVLMPFRFTDNLSNDLVFNAIVARYGLGLDYAETDAYLLDHEKEVTSTQFMNLLRTGNITREVVKNLRGMNDIQVRKIIQKAHIDLAKKGYKYQGFATVFKSTPFETIGVTHVRGDEVVYILFDNTNFKLPLLVYSYLSDAPLLFGSEEKLPVLDISQHPAINQLEKRLLANDYRTGKARRPTTVSTPPIGLLTKKEIELYGTWQRELN